MLTPVISSLFHPQLTLVKIMTQICALLLGYVVTPFQRVAASLNHSHSQDIVIMFTTPCHIVITTFLK